MCVRIVMTAWQWRNLHTCIQRTQAQYKTGHLAMGNHRGILASAIVLLVVDTQGTIISLQVMKGISIFARFKEQHERVGLSYEVMSAESFDKAEGKAFLQAREQIHGVINRQIKGGNKHDTVSTIN